jgi:hypothetical protein
MQAAGGFVKSGIQAAGTGLQYAKDVSDLSTADLCFLSFDSKLDLRDSLVCFSGTAFVISPSFLPLLMG